MIKELTFEKNEAGDTYVAEFTSTGPVTAQISRKGHSRSVVVSANLPGMSPTVIGVYSNGYGPDVLIGIDVPAGMDVTISCPGEVAEAKLMGDG